MDAGERDIMREDGGEEKGSARRSVHWGCDEATAIDIEVDPQRRRFGSRESDFALQSLIEGRAAKNGTCLSVVPMAFQWQ